MPAMRKLEKLLRAIAREESRLVSLQEDETQVRARLETLRADLDALGAAAGATRRKTAEADTPATAAEKVAVFRSLFRGRTDVFPRRWQNRRTVADQLPTRTIEPDTAVF